MWEMVSIYETFQINNLQDVSLQVDFSRIQSCVNCQVNGIFCSSRIVIVNQCGMWSNFVSGSKPSNNSFLRSNLLVKIVHVFGELQISFNPLRVLFVRDAKAICDFDALFVNRTCIERAEIELDWRIFQWKLMKMSYPKECQLHVHSP